MHLRAIITVRYISDCHASSSLGEEPIDELFHPLSLLESATHESYVANILQDDIGCLGELLAGGTLLAQGVAQLVIPENDPISGKAFVVRELLPHTACESSRSLGLNCTHHLELSSTSSTLVSKYGQLLRTAFAFAFATLLFAHEEHQRAPLFLHASQRSTASTRHVANAVTWDIYNGDVITILPAVHIDRTFKLIEEPLHVLLGALPLPLVA
mmetsp:Transcript_68771/g.121512  ORF Transcript_68771/g.121512 Transcript_68771/m.121512 type:complete len:213 (+) Transcript_68771:394-1032(+)